LLKTHSRHKPVALPKLLTILESQMKTKILGALALAGLVLTAGALPAQATPITWNLDGVTFSDGTTASGSFTIDAAAHTWSSLNISTMSGVLSAFTYDASNSGIYFNGFGPNAFSIIPGNGQRYLTFSFLDPLPINGGSAAINTAASWECNNCGTFRMVTHGSLTSAAANVPEPGTLAIMAPALGLIGFLARRRKYRAA
jgi:hypothetical protein